MKMKNLLTLTLLLCAAGLHAQNKAQGKPWVVAQDGSGRFRTIQEAFDAVPDSNGAALVIYVKNGVYREKLHLDEAKSWVTLKGQDPYNTIITYDDHTGKVAPNGDTINTFTSETIRIEGADFLAQDISFRNDAGPIAGQAVAVRIVGDRAVFRNCRFVGNQDVLFPSQYNSRQYFYGCYIEGTTDFIFGPSTAWFEHCRIYSKKNSHVTAASTPQEVRWGYIFHECALTGDSSLHSVSLGRPWRMYASVTYLSCYLGAQILPEGWNNWKNPSNEKTARFSEYNSCGPGANPAARAKWTYQLPERAVRGITLQTVMGEWDPLSR